MKRIVLLMFALLLLLAGSQSVFAAMSTNEGNAGKLNVDSIDKNKNIKDTFVLRPTSTYLTIDANVSIAEAVKIIQSNNLIETKKKTVAVLVQYDKETYGLLTPNDLIQLLMKKKTDKSFDDHKTIGSLANKLKTFSENDNAYQSTKLAKTNKQDAFLVKNSDGVVMLAGCTWYYLMMDPNSGSCTWGGACG